MKFFLQADEVIAEIEAPSALAATCTEEAYAAPAWTTLHDLATGRHLAQRRLTARGLAWVFEQSAEWPSEDATASQRSVA